MHKDGGVILVNFGESFGGLGAVMGGLQSSGATDLGLRSN